LTYLKVSSSVAKIFRLPTFNDLHWQPGGNPNLQPEHGYSAEGNIGFEKNKKLSSGANISLQIKETIFTRKVHNWIQWEPTGSFWTAQNLQEVWSRGAENNVRFSFKGKKIEWIAGTTINYTLATQPNNNTVQEDLRGKQLMYTPLYTVLNFTGISFAGIDLFLQQQYCGFRYTSSDNYQYLAPYRVYNASIRKSLQLEQFLLSTQFSIQNLLDESYQVVAQRPMPGRFFQIQISIQYH
jgi:iron complex outermembrane receptor protein